MRFNPLNFFKGLFGGTSSNTAPTGPFISHPEFATVQADQNTPIPPASTNTRPKLRPRGQKERKVAKHAKRNYAAEITYEEDDGDLPEGYLGT